LRKPTSKSMTTVLNPRKAKPEEKLALVVVLPTPPLLLKKLIVIGTGTLSIQAIGEEGRCGDFLA